MDEVQLKLSAQRALWGAVSHGLRAVSAEICNNTIYWQCVFESEDAKAKEWEDLSVAATEVISDAPEHFSISEEYLVVIPPNKMEHLRRLIFLRKE